MSTLLTLLETVTIRAYLMESQRPRFLKDNYGAKIEAKYNDVESTTPAPIIADIAGMVGNDIVEKIISYLIAHDPTRNHQYSQWLLMRWLKGDMLFEDAQRVMGYLEVFERAKSRIEKRDINSYRSPAALYDAVRPFIEDNAPVSSNAERTTEARRMHQEDQAKIVYDSPTLKIVTPLTQEASNFFGRNTQWCTTSAINSYFETYTQKGPLYIILEKATNKRWQFHFPTGQFMDERDHRISLSDFLNDHPEVFKLFPENLWIPYAGQTGLKWFSDAAKEAIGAEGLVQHVKSLSDFLTLPQNVQENRAIAERLATKVASTLTVEELDSVPASLRATDSFADPLGVNLGLHYLTDDEISKINPVRFCFMVDNERDAARVPERYLNDPVAMYHLCSRGVLQFSLMKGLLSSEVLSAILPNMPLWSLTMFPPELVTDEEKIKRAQQPISAHDFNKIPKPWPDAVQQRLYELEGTDIADVPAKFRSPTVVQNAMRRCGKAGYSNTNYPAGVKPFFQKWKKLITPEITASCIDSLSVEEIPIEFLNNQKCADALYRKIARHQNAYNRKRCAEMVVLSKMSPKFWNDEVYDAFLEAAKYSAKYKEKKPISFDIVPEQFRTEDGIIKFIDAYGDVSTVPSKLLTRNVLMSNAIGAKAISEIDPALLDDEIIVAAINRRTYSDDQFDLETIPKGRLTAAVVRALVQNGRIPIAKIPRSIRTPAAVVKRLGMSRSVLTRIEMPVDDDLKSLPAEEYTEAMCIALAQEHSAINLLKYAPKEALTTPVLEALLRVGRDDEDYNSYRPQIGNKIIGEAVAMFSQSTWNPEIVVELLKQGYLPREVSAVPKHLLTKEVAVEIARNKDEVHNIPAHLVGDDTHSAAILTNLKHVESLPSDALTEPVLFAALSKLSNYDDMEQNRGPYREKERDILSKLPRDVWSERCWMLAVSRIITLKEVPAKFRTPKLIATAIRRYPATLRTMRDPAGWIAKNVDLFANELADKNSKIEFHRNLERNGVLAIAKAPKYVNATTLHRKPLKGGFAYAQIDHQKGTRVYIFDKKDRFLTVLNQKEDHTVQYDFSMAKPLRDQIIEILNAPDHPLGDLNGGRYGIDQTCLISLDIYFENGVAMPQSKLTRVKRFGIGITKSGQTTYWVKDKPIANLRSETGKYSYGRDRGVKLTGFSVINWKLAFENRDKIATILTEDYKEHSVTSEMTNIGILVSAAGFKPINEVVVETATVVALRTKTRLFLFNKANGMIAQAKITSALDLTNVDIKGQSHYWQDDDAEQKNAGREKMVNTILEKVSEILKSSKVAK